MKKKRIRIWGREDQHRPHARPHTVNQQGAEPPIGKNPREVLAGGRDRGCGAVHQGFRPREDGLEDQRHHAGEDERAPDAVQHEGVESVRQPRRTRGPESGRATQRPGALPPGRKDVDHGKGATGGMPVVVLRGNHDRTGAHLVAAGVKGAEEAAYRSQRCRVTCVDERHLHTQFPGQSPAPKRAVPAVQFIRHGQHNQRREPQTQHRLGDHQMGAQERHVQNHHHRVRPPVAFEFAQQGASGDHLIRAAWRQPVHSRQIDDLHRPGRGLGDAGSALNGDARVVGHPLHESRETVEEGGLAGVRGTHQCDQRVIVAGLDRPGWPFREGSGRRRRVQFESRTPAASSELRTQRQDAVSLRSATSAPSTR